MKKGTRVYATPRPFLKWVGGKGQLLPQLLAKVDDAAPFERYHEPFVGGGALFFELYREGRLGRKHSYLSDSNKNLVIAYAGVHDDVEGVIDRLKMHGAKHDHDYYYDVRANVPTDTIDQAARLIYLNKTCFNGLYRENSKGLFNVPLGRYKNPMICDEPNLRAVSEALKRTRIKHQPFDAVFDLAEPGDLVYFDPPYVPLSNTANFTSYAKGGFGEDEQRRLAEVYAALAADGVHVMLSNSMTPLVRKLYKKFAVEKVLAKRMVNSRADKRGKVAEALVCTFR
jgi:DNA adenine methylase